MKISVPDIISLFGTKYVHEFNKLMKISNQDSIHVVQPHGPFYNNIVTRIEHPYDKLECSELLGHTEFIKIVNDGNIEDFKNTDLYKFLSDYCFGSTAVLFSKIKILSYSVSETKQIEISNLLFFSDKSVFATMQMFQEENTYCNTEFPLSHYGPSGYSIIKVNEITF